MRPSASVFLDATKDTVAFARVVVFGMWLVVVVLTPLDRLAVLPPELSHGLGPFFLLPRRANELLLSSGGLMTLRWALVTLLVPVVLGVRPYRLFAVPAAVLLLVFDGVIRSFGGFGFHSTFAPLYFALILSVCPAADGLSVSTRARALPRAHYVASMAALAAIFAMAYVFVGGRRLAGGLGVFTTDSLVSWVATKSLEPSGYGFTVGLKVLEYPALAAGLKVGFVVVTGFEILSPLILVSNVFRRAWIVVTVPFHFFTLLTMNIFFWQNALLSLLVFTGFSYRVGPHFSDGTARQPIIFYDGACGLCNRFVQWVMKRDESRVFRFAPLQGETARQLQVSREPDPGAWSLVLLDDGEQHLRSDASLRILMRLGGVSGLVGSFLTYVPRSLRDGVYRVVARRRYGWFGNDVCALGMHQGHDVLLP